MTTFDSASRSEEVSPGVYEVNLDGRFAVGDKLHGGYLLATTARAAAHGALRHPDLSAVSATFISPPGPGRAVVETTVLREGKSVTQVHAVLRQGGTDCLAALITLGALQNADPFFSTAARPQIPDEESCVQIPANGPFVLPIMDVVQHRVDPGVLGFVAGKPRGSGQVGAWIRHADGAPWDPFSLLIPLDASPPVSLELGVTGWAPTIQFTAFIRNAPAPGPVQVHTTSAEISSGRMDETTTVWDSAGRIVGQAMQLAGVRLPD
ncbi:thioesterase family protein [Lolliginicoccus levis]|uniref:thioesterase family protein n=1 Tax=Lolliginicoccus levis TaxID=2919542 RepID=UPI00242007D0|nr:thioesterase family protein [Lolliginicoccus levis]